MIERGRETETRLVIRESCQIFETEAFYLIGIRESLPCEAKLSLVSLPIQARLKSTLSFPLAFWD